MRVTAADWELRRQERKKKAAWLIFAMTAGGWEPIQSLKFI